MKSSSLINDLKSNNSYSFSLVYAKCSRYRISHQFTVGISQNILVRNEKTKQKKNVKKILNITAP